MILQTGLRTDIPAFYTPWFLNRLAEGFVLARNLYNTCGHGCRYCYAMMGQVRPGDVIRVARQESWQNGQIILAELL